MNEDFIKVNSYYEGLLQNLYAGTKGCFATFMCFFYQFNQSVVFSQNNSDCFSEIYQLELKNCVLISELILRIGGDNKYYSSSRKFLTGQNVDYIKDFTKIYLFDIELLEIGIIEVKNIYAKVENKKIKETLKKVLENKRKELKILKENYFKNHLLN
ncbi:MAG: hypothetical protein ACI4R8_05075 [Candidatus Caccovivens sp.]